MSDIVEEAKRLLAAATPGPWIHHTWFCTEGGWAAIGPHHELTAEEQDAGESDDDGSGPHDRAEVDAAFIAAAPRLVAGLLAEVDGLRKLGCVGLATARAERERDEARALFDATNSQLIKDQARLITAERERDEARAEVERLQSEIGPVRGELVRACEAYGVLKAAIEAHQAAFVSSDNKTAESFDRVLWAALGEKGGA